MEQFRCITHSTEEKKTAEERHHLRRPVTNAGKTDTLSEIVKRRIHLLLVGVEISRERRESQEIDLSIKNIIAPTTRT